MSEEKEEPYSLLVKPTTAFSDQKPGTSGLRKTVKVFTQKNYLQNFIQSIFDSLDRTIGCTLVLGGDGRFWNDKAIAVIIRMAAANLVSKIVIGQKGIMSTPNVSDIVRKKKAYGAIILTASHNPGGENGDFGVKYNGENGGPATSLVTSKIFEISKKIETYKIAVEEDPKDVHILPTIVDINKVGTYKFAGMEIEVIDAVSEYVNLMKGIFDFKKVKNFVNRDDFSMCFDSMNGVAGPFAKAIFNEELGLSEETCINSIPKEDFGGLHPDPNLKYAAVLVKKMGLGEDPNTDNIPEFGAAADGDADRNMIIGKKFFVTPSDSVAIIAANWECIPYFKGGLKGVARSMPTSGALDFVAEKLKIDLFEVPTGWKYFGNLMDNQKLSLCGEESFGTGSDHVREKDGIWAVLAWLSILASKNETTTTNTTTTTTATTTTTTGTIVGVADVVNAHWKEYGRNYYTRYDYEGVTAEAAEKMMEHLRAKTKEFTNDGKKWEFGDSEKRLYEIKAANEFEYTDPVDHSVAKKQGIRFIFTDNSRVIFRLSGTGSVGATIRMYIEKYESPDGKLDQETADALVDLINIGLEVSDIEKFTGRKEPTVIT